MKFKLDNLRKYGTYPFKVAVIHGGPGAAGGMAEVAKELSKTCGVLEPLQTAKSLIGQVDELNDVLKKYSDLPVVLIGHSWGAWLSLIFSAKHPDFIKKLILVASAPFEEKYSSNIMEKRLSRLTGKEILEIYDLFEVFSNEKSIDKNNAFCRLGELLTKADCYNPISTVIDELEYNYNIYKNVWKEAEELRQSGKLIEFCKQIRSPVVAIHGDYDPHPAEGIEKLLLTVVQDFRFILLEKCGHYPWLEKDVKEEFYNVLKNEIM